jgi:hypothetical protein
MRQETTGAGGTSRDWGWITVDGVLRVVCYPSEKSNCFVVGQNTDGSYGLVLAKETAAYHDETLAKATREINAVLTRVVRENSNPERHLHFIQASGGLMLAWGNEVTDKEDVC